MSAALIALVLLVSIASGLLIYVFVRRERRGTRMSREAAERTARRNTDDSDP